MFYHHYFAPHYLLRLLGLLLLIAVFAGVAPSANSAPSANGETGKVANATTANTTTAAADTLEPLELYISVDEAPPAVDEKGISKFQKYITKLQGSLSAANANFDQGRYKRSGKLFADAASQMEKSDRPDRLKLFAIHYSAAYSYYLAGNKGSTIVHINKALDNLGEYRATLQAEFAGANDSSRTADDETRVKAAEMEAYYILGDALIAQGESSQGQQALASAVAIADDIGAEPFARSVNWRLFQEQVAHERNDDALLTLNKSLGYYQRDKNDFMIATTLYQKGVLQLGNNDYSASYRSFSNAISIAKNHGYLELMGRSYMGLSESSLGIGSYFNAALNLENAIDIVVSAEMSDVYLPSSRKLINIYRLIGEYEKALYISDKRIQFAIERQNTTLEAQLYVEKGDTYQYINDQHNATLLYAAAANTIKQAQSSSKGDRAENDRTLGDTYYKLALTYNDMGDATHTEIYALEAAVALDKLDDERATEVYTLLGGTYMELNLYPQGIEAFNTALKRSNKYGQTNQLPYIYKQLGMSYKARGDVKNSIALLENSLSLSQDYRATTALGALYTLEGRTQEGIATLAAAVEYYNTTTNRVMQSNSRYNYAVANLRGGNYDEAMASLRLAHAIDIAQKNRVQIAQDLYTKGAIQYYTDALADSITNANSATAIVEELMGESNATVGDGYKTMIRQIQHLKIASAIRNNDVETALQAGEYLNLIDLPQGYVRFNLKGLQRALNSSEVLFATLPAEVNTQDGVLDTAVIIVTATSATGRIVSIPLHKNPKEGVTKGRLKTAVQPLLAEQLSSPTPYRFDYPYSDIQLGAKIINNQKDVVNNRYLYQALIQPYQDTGQLDGKVIWFYGVSIYSQVDFELLQNSRGTLLAQQNRIVYAPAISPLGQTPSYVANRAALNQTIVLTARGEPIRSNKYSLSNVSTYLNALDEATLSSPLLTRGENPRGENLASIYNSIKMGKSQGTERILPARTTTVGLNRYVPSQRLAVLTSKEGVVPEGSEISLLTTFRNATAAEDYPFINTVVLNQCREFGGGNGLSYIEMEQNINISGGSSSNLNIDREGRNNGVQQYFMRYGEIAGLALGGNTVVMPNCIDTPNFRLNMGNARAIPIALYFAQATAVLRNINAADDNNRVFLYQYMYEAFQEGKTGVDALHTVQRRYMNGALGEDNIPPANWNKFRVYANIYR